MNRRALSRMSAVGVWLVRVGVVATVAWIVFLIWALFNVAFGADWTWHRDRAGLCGMAHAKAFAALYGIDKDAAFQAAATSGAWVVRANVYPEDPARVWEIERMVSAMTLDELADTIERFCPSPWEW
ncbi:MAG: hypothetical protein ACK4RK_21750 [Gemmataceae bacterium]